MHRVDPAVASLLSRLALLLRTRFGARLERLVLFGSHARGDAREDSDVDVLVVLDAATHAERGEVAELAYRASREEGPEAPLPTPLVWTPAEHTDRLSRERRLALDIEREGIPL